MEKLNRELIDSFKKETGNDATYKKEASTYHTLKYVNWLEKHLLEPKEDKIDKLIVEINNIKNNNPKNLSRTHLAVDIILGEVLNMAKEIKGE